MTDMRTLGHRMRGRREELGYTLAAVAEMTNLSVPYLANLENGRGNPTFNVLNGVAHALHVALQDLVQGPSHSEQALADESLRLATMPDSLRNYSRTRHFKDRVEQLAAQHDVSGAEMRSALLKSLSAAPLTLKDGEFETRDWDRLVDAYVLVLQNA